MTGRTRARLVAGTALLAPLGIGLVVQQWSRYDTARETLRDTRAHCEEALNQARAAEGRRRQLEREIQLTEADLARIAAILPDTLDADEFAAHVRKRAEAALVTFIENDFRADDGAEPPSGALSAVLEGEEAALASFVERIPWWPRLVICQEVDRGDGWRLCTLKTWAAPEEDEEEVDELPMPARVPWLPPFTTLLTRERAHTEGAVRRVEAHRDVLARVRRYEHVKHRLEVVVDLVNELKTQVDAVTKERTGS